MSEEYQNESRVDQPPTIERLPFQGKQQPDKIHVLMPFALGIVVGALIVGGIALFVNDFPERDLFTSRYEPTAATERKTTVTPTPESVEDTYTNTAEPTISPSVSVRPSIDENGVPLAANVIDCTMMYPDTKRSLDGVTIKSVDKTQPLILTMNGEGSTNYVRWDKALVVVDEQCMLLSFKDITPGDLVNVYSLDDGDRYSNYHKSTRVIQIIE